MIFGHVCGAKICRILFWSVVISKVKLENGAKEYQLKKAPSF